MPLDYSCYCDYEPPEVFRKSEHKARKPHRCGECACDIRPGETYEYVWGKWFGQPDIYKTCERCLAFRKHLDISLPCWCWCYSTMLDDAREELIDVNHILRSEAPGALFAMGRLAVAIRRRARADREARNQKRNNP